MTVTASMAPGALASSVPTDMLSSLFDRPDDYRSYLDSEEAFDSQESVLGLAVAGAGGLVVVAERRPGADAAAHEADQVGMSAVLDREESHARRTA